MRQPPNSVPSAIAAWQDDHHPERHVERLAQHALRIEQHGDDAHGLLRIVAAMAERIERGRDELQHAEGAGRRQTACCARTVHDTASTSSSASTKPIAGDSTIAAAVFSRPDQTIAPQPALASPPPTKPADQRVRTARRDAEQPGDDVPDDRADQRREDHLRVDDIGIDDARAQRLARHAGRRTGRR